ncbi:hypothetical protein ACLBP2_21450, partial [Klebsiella pneumoniae]
MRDLILQLSKSSIYSTKPGIGYKLAFWGQHDPNTIYASANDVILPNLALGTGVLIAAWVYIRYLKR